MIDHIAKPPIAAQAMEPWARDIEAAAQLPQVYCKLSGMITEADHRNWTPDHLRPYVEHVVECFGFDRVMFGSDWPVCLLAGEYDRVFEALRTILAPVLNPASEAALWGNTAARFYKIF